MILMAKNFGKCGLCKSMKFLNFAGLCKRCNQDKASSKIADKAMKAQQEKNAAKKVREEQLAKQQAAMEEQAKDTDTEGDGEGTEGEAEGEGAEGENKKEK